MTGSGLKGQNCQFPLTRRYYTHPSQLSPQWVNCAHKHKAGDRHSCTVYEWIPCCTEWDGVHFMEKFGCAHVFGCICSVSWQTCWNRAFLWLPGRNQCGTLTFTGVSPAWHTDWCSQTKSVKGPYLHWGIRTMSVLYKFQGLTPVQRLDKHSIQCM